MGSYLSEPVTEKESSDHSNERLICGASSMQGWRISQEDAHNCLLDYEANAALFAVYDGHGGHEVAHYCAQKLPGFIKALSEYKDGKIEEALVKGFLGFDALIATPEVISVLKELAGDKEAEESDEDNVNNLYEEAAMPIEQVIEKYTSNLMNPAVKGLKKADDKLPKSPFLKGKKQNDDADVGTSASGSSSAGGSSSAKSSSTPAVASDSCGDGVSSSSEAKDEPSKKLQESNGDKASKSAPSSASPAKAKEDEKTSAPDSSDMKVDDSPAPSDSAVAGSAAESSAAATVAAAASQNGEATGNDVSSSSTSNGDVKGKGKGKAKPKAASPAAALQRPKRNAQQLYKTWLEKDRENEEDDSDDEEDEEEDETFEGPNESSDEEMDTSNAALGDEDTSEDEEEEEEEDDDDDVEEEEDEDDENLAFARNMKEEPGSDSGCTAVVALLHGNELFVANAGDSRCIVCRDGKAVDMSFDHKPEDEPEKARIIKAGGKVTGDGRVNGGLNLSRAIGDHAYKQNKKLSDKEQMITALPDIKKLTIDLTRDEFMVLACDGIWNFMSSQEVVDFVRPRLEQNQKLSLICEEMFDHCLAPNNMGDGTGCDNMTAIIVKFVGGTSSKRTASPQPAPEPKRAKTEDNGGPEAQIDTTV